MRGEQEVTRARVAQAPRLLCRRCRRGACATKACLAFIYRTRESLHVETCFRNLLLHRCCIDSDASRRRTNLSIEAAADYRADFPRRPPRSGDAAARTKAVRAH